MRSGKPAAYRQAIIDGVYRALRETFDVPEDDQFMAITEHDAANFRFGSTYLNVNRSENVVFIQITASNTRTFEKKKALFARIAQHLVDIPGLRPEDVFINLVEVAKENWSSGHRVGQYA
jgi:phenylpyruvate tautomerase PptA (4-oxalocrotonate tautomerase family)